MTTRRRDPEIKLEPGEKPTLKTISRLSGMAVPTVSRALHDAPDINIDTKRKIREIAQQIGYSPNRAGVRLRTGKTNVISLLISPEADFMSHTATLIRAINLGLRGSQYHLNITPFFAGDDPLRPIKYVVETGSADAVVLNETLPEDPRVAYLMKHNFPFVTHGRTQWCEQHPYFDYDNGAYGAFAVDHLAARGRKHLAMIAPPRGQFYAEEMIEGAKQRAEALGLDLHIIRRITSDSTSEKIRGSVTDFLQQNPAIDAFICASPMSAMGAANAAEALDRTLGGDLDIFAKEASPFLKFFRKDIIVVKEDVDRAGKFIARAALLAIDDPEAPPMQGLQVPKTTDLI